MGEKAIIFDASTLISFAMASLYDELKKLKQTFNGKFLITQEIKKEIVDKPMAIKRFQLEALKIQQLIDEKILEMPSSLGIKDSDVSAKALEMVNLANSSFMSRGKEMKLIDSGEASCFALSKLITEKGINNLVAVDERTMRMLCENPDGLKKYLGRKMRTNVQVKKTNFEIFKGFKIIRSIELIYVTWKKGLIGKGDKNWLDALVHALRFKGASISDDEIEEILRIG